MRRKKIFDKLAIMKFVLLPVASLIASIHSQQYMFFPVAAVEILLIFALTNIFAKKHGIIAYVFNSALYLIVFAEQCVLFFSGNYVMAIMLENIPSIGALGDALYVYVGCVCLILIVSFFPVRHFDFSVFKMKGLTFSALGGYSFVLVLLFMHFGNSISPVEALFVAAKDIVKTKADAAMYAKMDAVAIKQKYYMTSIDSGVSKPEQLPEKPNVIVLFTEGMSAEVIDRYAGRENDLTPNIDSFFDASLVFDNYYCHTVATYKGLRGQLNSGFVYFNEDLGGNSDSPAVADDGQKMSSNLISIVDVLNDAGYNTLFVNSEPSNLQFTAYLNSFGCDTVTSGAISGRLLTDKEAFGLLETVSEQLTQPFFAGFYNIGTHHGFESPDEKYREGTNAILNKFFNYDAQFGSFWNYFQNSKLADNTILVFTADHSTFDSPEYKAALNSDQNYFINTIPLMIYYRGVTHEIIDAKGRNSLGLTPTLLDILDLEVHDNYFLGTSLFTDRETPFEKMSEVVTSYYYTGDGGVTAAKDDGIIESIREYYAISSQ